MNERASGESKKGWIEIVGADAALCAVLARELVEELRSSGRRASLREPATQDRGWSVASQSVVDTEVFDGLAARVAAFSRQGACHVWVDDGSAQGNKVGQAVMSADVNAMRVKSHKGAARRIGAMLGALDWDAGESFAPVGDPCSLEITSLGPMGFGAVSLRASIPAAALAAWEARRGRMPGACADEFAALVERLARERQWRPQLARGAAAGVSTLRLTPLGDCPLPPDATIDGSLALARCVREAASAMGLRPKLSR